jgi:hypothetical protein
MADDPYGWARSNAYTNLELTLTNTSDIALTFSFDFEAILDAQVEGGAIAETGVFIDGPNNTYLDAFAFDTADVLLLGDFDLVVAAGQDATILVGVDSFGEAFVPVPAAVWLFGSGLLGMIGIARRKQAA